MFQFRLASISLLAALSLGKIAPAQEMPPLANVFETAAPIYPYVRCAGLYQAVMEWAGSDRMGAETWKNTETARTNCISAGVIIGMQDGLGPINQATAIVARDTRNVANLYIKRFEANFAREGHAWGKDPIFQSDLEFCKSVAVFSEQMVGHDSKK